MADLGILVHNACMTNWRWKDPRDWADYDHTRVRDRIRQQQRGFESGRHDQFSSEMRDELRRLANEAEGRGDLEEYVQRLRDISETYAKRARGAPHRGG